MISDFVSFMNYKLKHFVDAVDIMREIKHLIRLMFFAYLETLISLGMEADFPNAGKGGLVLMKKLHGACLGDPWSSSVLFRFESLDLEPKSRIYELEDCY